MQRFGRNFRIAVLNIIMRSFKLNEQFEFKNIKYILQKGLELFELIVLTIL